MRGPTAQRRGGLVLHGFVADGFEPGRQRTRRNPPEVPPYPRGDTIFINVAPQRGMRNSPENVR